MGNYILFADDDQDDFTVLKDALKETNAQIELVSVENGYDVIKFLQDKSSEQFPSLIIMDMKMPMLGGKETLELLRIDDRFKTIPVILISGSYSKSETDELAKKAMEVIKKPS